MTSGAAIGERCGAAFRGDRCGSVWPGYALISGWFRSSYLACAMLLLTTSAAVPGETRDRHSLSESRLTGATAVAPSEQTRRRTGSEITVNRNDRQGDKQPSRYRLGQAVLRDARGETIGLFAGLVRVSARNGELVSAYLAVTNAGYLAAILSFHLALCRSMVVDTRQMER